MSAIQIACHARGLMFVLKERVDAQRPSKWQVETLGGQIVYAYPRLKLRAIVHEVERDGFILDKDQREFIMQEAAQ